VIIIMVNISCEEKEKKTQNVTTSFILIERSTFEVLPLNINHGSQSINGE